jgi:hypothetical protein
MSLNANSIKPPNHSMEMDWANSFVGFSAVHAKVCASAVVQLGRVIPIPRDPGVVFDNSFLPADDPIKEGGFPHVGSSHDCDNGFHGSPSSPFFSSFSVGPDIIAH